MCIRARFQDRDNVRVHAILTMGGASVNSVPADVRLETFVRGNNLEAIADASAKVDRSLRAGAMAVGGSVTITTLPGYLPIQSEPKMVGLHKANAESLVGADRVTGLGHRTGPTDMGDLSQIMPVIHPYVLAASGNAHGDDYLICDCP